MMTTAEFGAQQFASGYSQNRAERDELLVALKQAEPIVAAHAKATGGDGSMTLLVMRHAIANAERSA